jgi:NitT/TauT family transport system substrate-binding protein
MGFADIAALLEFLAQNQHLPQARIQAVYMMYSDSPAAVFVLKKSGITAPAGLNGKVMGAPVFDAGRRAFPIFAKANGLDASKFKWQSMDPPLRETMLARGDVEAITGFSFTSRLNLEARGAKTDEIVVMPYAAHGVKLYGNVIIASPKLLKENPAAVKGFLKAFAKGAREVMANPDAAIDYVKARDGIINVDLEKRRLRLAIDSVVASADARAEGFGQVVPGRLALMASQVSDAFTTKTRVDPNAVWTDAFLPSKAELNILPPAKK